MEVVNVREQLEYKEKAISYFQRVWANEQSQSVYEDCITRSTTTKNPLPVWYLLLNNSEIIGCAGLITNDFNSCMDLCPWLCALYIEPSYRGNDYGSILISKIKDDVEKLGFPKVFLCTDHIGYYEKYGFHYICDCYHPWGEKSRVYEYAV
jgi:N-acetylglutamate synthase-like GNAT family acetyltransferase